MRAAAHRNHPAYWAFLTHRLSGLALALFLPAHFLVLALAVEESSFDAFVAWTERPLVKLAEAVLVGLLALHMAGGLRLLALEFLPWSDTQKTRIALAFGAGLAAVLLHLLMARP